MLDCPGSFLHSIPIHFTAVLIHVVHKRNELQVAREQEPSEHFIIEVPTAAKADDCAALSEDEWREVEFFELHAGNVLKSEDARHPVLAHDAKPASEFATERPEE